jgi:hypothetical protein
MPSVRGGWRRVSTWMLVGALSLAACARTVTVEPDAAPEDAFIGAMDAGTDAIASLDAGADAAADVPSAAQDAVADDVPGQDGTVADAGIPCTEELVATDSTTGYFQDAAYGADRAWLAYKAPSITSSSTSLRVTSISAEGLLGATRLTLASGIPPAEQFWSIYSHWATMTWADTQGVVAWAYCWGVGSLICSPWTDNQSPGWWELRARAFTPELEPVTDSQRIIATGSAFNTLTSAWDGTLVRLATVPDDLLDSGDFYLPQWPDYDAALFLLDENGAPRDLTFEDHTGVMSAQPIEMQPRPDRVLLEAEDDGTVHALYRTVPEAPDGGVPEERVLHLGSLGLDGALEGMVLDEGAHLVDASGRHGLDLGAIGRLTLLPDGRRAVAWVGEFEPDGPAEQSTLAIVEPDGSSALRRVLPSVTSILWHEGQLLVTTFDGTSSELLVLDPATLDTVMAYPAPGKARHLVAVDGGFLVISQVTSSVVISRLECVEPPDAGPDAAGP